MFDILILHDEPSWQEPLLRSLRPFHNIEVVNSHALASQKLRRQRYDLLITRVHLRRRNLFDILEELKADPATAEVPVLCFCGIRTRAANVANDAVRAATTALGAAEFLSIEQFCLNQKCDLTALREAIESAILNSQKGNGTESF